MPRTSSIPRASSAQPVSPIDDYLAYLYAELLQLRDGEVADYIPELAQADPEQFAIALATVDGTIYSCGDCTQTFTIQSISKPLVFGLALDDLGEAEVLSRIGVEPSGEPFNSITLGPDGRPPNPMVNAGAITATAMIPARDGVETIDRIVGIHSAYAGRPLQIDGRTAQSERATGERNRAISHLLRAAGVIDGDPVAAVETYFRQCSIALNTRDAAVIAATLAAGGVNPLTGERVAAAETVRHVLSVMASCGMYDGAGEWLYTVGLPAKSGVSGTVIAVLPGALGIAVNSPRLDANGNSVRGVSACRRLTHDLDLHLLGEVEQRSPVHHQFNLAEAHSRRRRPDVEIAALQQLGRRAIVLELRGHLHFMAAEQISRSLLGRTEPTDFAILDLYRVERIDPIAAAIITELGESLGDRGSHLLLASDDTPSHSRAGASLLARFRYLDDALEWCEDQLLDAADAGVEPATIEITEHPLLAGLDPSQLERVLALLTRHEYPAGATISALGDERGELQLLTGGRVTLALPDKDGSLLRLSTLLPGMSFGEIPFLNGTPNTFAVKAETAVVTYALPRSVIDLGVERDPEIASTLLLNLARGGAARSDSMRAELLTRANL